jgi:hypothetical protein
MIPSLWELIDYTINTLGKENVPVIWSYQNAARIKKPYIALNYTSDDLPDHDWFSNIVDYQGFRIMGTWRKAVVDLQVYASEDSMRLANKLAMLLATESSLDKQQQLDVAIGNRLFFARVPALLNNSQYEDRAIYHFDFMYTESLREDVGFIATVEIEGTYEGSLIHLNNPDDPKNKCHITVSVPYPDTQPPPLEPQPKEKLDG